MPARPISTRIPWRLRVTTTVFALVLAASLVGCAGQRHSLALREVSPSLQKLEGSPYDSLASQPIYYTIIGEPDYDRFFKEAAAIHATLLFAQHAVARAQSIVDGRAQPNPIDFALMLTLLTETLPRAHQRAVFLSQEGKRLRKRVYRDFAWKFYKIPRVSRAVSEARDHLGATQRLAPELLQQIKVLYLRAKYNRMFDQSL